MQNTLIAFLSKLNYTFNVLHHSFLNYGESIGVIRLSQNESLFLIQNTILKSQVSAKYTIFSKWTIYIYFFKTYYFYSDTKELFPIFKWYR